MTELLKHFPYNITLTRPERMALDWVGHRYFHGDDLKSILHEMSGNWYYIIDGEPAVTDGDVCWESELPIMFEMPEHVAWLIQEGIQCENYELACLAPGLKAKFIQFCDSIV